MDSVYNSFLRRLEGIGYVPVTCIYEQTNIEQLIACLMFAETPCLEIAYRNEFAGVAIQKISQHEDILVGAGTVLRVEQAKEAIDAGAQFIVSPGFNRDVVEYCLSRKIPIIPGVANATQIEEVQKYNIPIIKFFPSESLGGLQAIDALASLYPLKFFPTGGIGINNVADYLKRPYVAAVGGTAIINPELLQKNDYEAIKKEAKQLVAEILGFSLAHVGINADGQAGAQQISSELSALLGHSTREVPGVSYFVGTEYEIMFDGLGEHGHLAFATNSIEVAIRIFEDRGYTFNEDFIRKDASGRVYLAYLQKEIGGFACHLVQRI